MNAADTPEHKCGEIVYHRADGVRGVVTGVTYRAQHIGYQVSFAYNGGEVECQACELTKTKPIEGIEHDGDEEEITP